MMIDVISLCVAIGSILIVFISHIKHSECYGISMDTKMDAKTEKIERTERTPLII